MEKNKRTRTPHVKVSLHNKVTTGGILLFFDYSQVSVLRIFFFLHNRSYSQCAILNLDFFFANFIIA